MSTSHPCPRCGAKAPGELLQGLCPRCVVRVALMPDLEEIAPQGLDNDLEPTPKRRVRYLGDYELLAEVACGGMGVVYRARQVSLNRVVALKMLLHGALATEEGVRRFRAEAEAAASLQHPNIVAIHEIGSHEGLLYFSMDYVDGPNLDQLARDGPLACERAARYVRLIAEAVHYAHQHGVLHRDLKPSNVLIDSFDQPRLTDFGLAKRLATASDLTVTGQILGSVSYMSPEQGAGPREQVGVSSDVYSLGAILYHLLTGRPPFETEAVHQTLLLLQTTEPIPPRQLNASVPLELETVCLKCLKKSPQQRYQTAAALAEDIRRWEKGEPVLARRAPLAERVWRTSRRHPALSSLATLAALGLGALLFFRPWPAALPIPPQVTELIVLTDNTEVPTTLAITDPSGSFYHRLPIQAGFADISPSGQLLCLVRPDGPTNSSIWISRLNGAGQSRVVCDATSPLWLDDRTLLYQPLDHLSLWAIDIFTRKPHKLFDWTAITPRGHAGLPVRSPDGSRLLVNPQNGWLAHRSDVYVCEPDGSNVRVVWEDAEAADDPDSGISDHCLVWVSDTQVAWCRHARSGNRVFDMAIVTCRLGDTNLQALSSWKGFNYPLAASPDGKRILFLTEDSPGLGNLELWTMNADGTDRRRLFERKFGADFGVYARWIKRPR